MASIDYMCDVGYAAPPKSVQPVRQATSVVCLFLCYHPPEGGKYRKGESNMFCPKCGNDMGENRFCQKCGFDSKKEEVNPVVEKKEYTPHSNMYSTQKKRKSGCFIFFIIILIVIAIAFFAALDLESSGGNSGSGYMSIDREQATEEHCKSIAYYMNNYLNEKGYSVTSYYVQWIGYYKYKDVYSKEEYSDLELGGYYSYTGNLSTGEVALADIRTYWGENEEPVIVYLHVETENSENEIIPYSDEAISECFRIYTEKAGIST